MVDLRKRVEEERSLLKKIELAIPGFRGYRKREDARAADRLLRTQLANMIKATRDRFEGVKRLVISSLEMDLIEDSGKISNLMYEIEGRIRHAECGYSPLSADYRIDVDELYKLYEWDLSLLDACKKLDELVSEAEMNANYKNWLEVRNKFKEMRLLLENIRHTFDKRIFAIANLLVEG